MGTGLLPEEAGLAGYAMTSAASRGRVHDEPEHAFRGIYQRDRDRVVHSTAFRRLEYKTQVFVIHEGDHYRTRLTHTIEVAQISRTLARALGLNEDLTEACALAHDVGHTPFGHSGEEVMDELMRAHGGFEHNQQGLRVVDFLEHRYAAFPGLNLSYEVREAFLRHHTQYDKPGAHIDFDLDAGSLLEIQATVIADEIAYDNHDVDDGLFSGILREPDLHDLSLWRAVMDRIGPAYRDMPPDLKRAEGVRRMINLLVTDVIDTTRARIADLGLKSLADVRQCRKPVFAASEQVAAWKSELERFLFEKFYRHSRVKRMANKAQHFIQDLFLAYVNDPLILPEEYQARVSGEDLHRVVADYIAGMTDRYAEDEYRKLFHPFEKP